MDIPAGFVYPGFSTDPVENFSRATTTQAWTVRAALLPRRRRGAAGWYGWYGIRYHIVGL